MEPKLSFTIPSIHDDTILDCRLYYSTTQVDTNHPYRARGAIVAHPYAPLGGCYDDPLVGIIVSEILKHSFGFVCTFNFRGAYGSAGHTSWTGKAERADYESLVGFMIEYLRHCEAPTAPESNVLDKNCDMSLQLVLGGYSYGSWICSHLSEPLDIWTKQFEAATDGSAAAEIKARALHLATQTNHEICTAWQDANTRGSHTLIVGGEETSPERVRRSGEGSPNRFSSDVRKSLDFRKSLASVRKKHYEASSSVPQDGQASNRAKARPDPLPELKLHVGYLLVSPLLPPISAFTTLPFGLNALKANSEDILQKLAANPSLAVFGSDDMFTSARKLRGWAQDISIKPSSRFQFVEVDGAGHFWRSISAQKSLRIAVTEWIQGLSSGTPKTAGT